jgi:hypothetical protein
MANKAAMINRAAGFLNVYRLGQALPAAHNVRLMSAYDEVYAQLKKEGLAVWASDGDAPDELVSPVAALMAQSCLDTYKVSPELFARIEKVTGPDGELAKSLIRKYTTPAYQSTDDPTDY